MSFSLIPTETAILPRSALREWMSPRSFHSWSQSCHLITIVRLTNEVMTMSIPGFTAEAALNSSNKHYRITTRPFSKQRVIAQSKLTCAFKAGRLAGRCLQLGFDRQDCMQTAADFNDFCNEHDL